MERVSFEEELADIERVRQAAAKKFKEAAENLLSGTDCSYAFVSLEEDIRDIADWEVDFSLSVQEGEGIAARCYAVSRDGSVYSVRLDETELASVLKVWGEAPLPPIETLQYLLDRLVAGEYLADEVLLPVGPIFMISEIDQH